MKKIDNVEPIKDNAEEIKKINLDPYKNQVFCMKLTDREKKLCINFAKKGLPKQEKHDII